MHTSHNIVGTEAFTPRVRFHPAHGSLRAFTARRDLGKLIAFVCGAGVLGLLVAVWSVA